MAQSSQSTPTVTANISGTNHQVNLRDYLNIRVAPFLKKAIAESLDAAPEFPLQWLGENLIHQSMLYEGNPDGTKIRERFLYNFDTPTTLDSVANSSSAQPAIPQSLGSNVEGNSLRSASNIEGGSQAENSDAQDAQMSNHVNGNIEVSQSQQEEVRDTEMEGTS